MSTRPAGFHIPRGPHTCVSFDSITRARAIQSLWSADEVAHLWSLPASTAYPIPIPLQVSAWLRDSILHGEMQYLPDPLHCDRWCSPAKTMERGFGDCDDFAILVASLLAATGLATWVVIGTVQHFSHAWVEGYDEARRPFLIEPTTGDLSALRPVAYQGELAVNPDECVRIGTPMR